jgi:hypothetical protein
VGLPRKCAIVRDEWQARRDNREVREADMKRTDLLERESS